jgi:hypothetical protein
VGLNQLLHTHLCFEDNQKELSFPILRQLIRPGLRWEQKVGISVPSASNSHPRHLEARKGEQNILKSISGCQRRQYLLQILHMSWQDSRPYTSTHGADQKSFFSEMKKEKPVFTHAVFLINEAGP